MNLVDVERLRSAIHGMLSSRGHRDPVDDTESLFISGRLDSHAATEVIMILEGDFGVDLSDADFDITALDTISDIATLIVQRKSN